MLNYLIFFALTSFSILNAENCVDYSTDLDSNLDLETLTQEFVVEVKQLHIPGHPHACNPSLIRWNNYQLLLSTVKNMI